MANPIAVPGTNVPSGAAVSPGGSQGPTTVSANANNKATLGTDSLLLVQGTAAGVAATTHAQTVSGDDPQLTNARTPTAHEVSHVTGSDQIPLASASTKGLMNQTSGNTTDFIDGTNNSQALQPVIWSATRRVFNSLGNPTFEVDQRQVGNLFAVTTAGAGGPVIDRWTAGLTGTLRYSVQQIANNTLVPGTNYCISRSVWRITMTTTQASLGVSDVLNVWQSVEGPRLRELLTDVHSVSILVRSSIANLKFSVCLQDVAGTRALAKLCTLGAANTFSLITLPNLLVWPGGATWSTSPGVVGYYLNITLAAGTNIKVAANDTWQTVTTQYAATGIDNFAANAGATFDLAFVQHEPGALCTTPIDCSFGQNLDGDMGCLRYYEKSYPYGSAPGALTVAGAPYWFQPNAATTNCPVPIFFKKTMAKAPTVLSYSPSTGASGTLRDVTAPADVSVTSYTNIGDAGFGGFITNVARAALTQMTAHYTADTAW